ncbi:aminopeptidase O isoform X4 [Siniperca chuatsi]|uniref:aminopeptidase O isoform X4 n=1 Tax=Siniperca chuatsi TaxID=119488 RepID=UPI001CE1483A|nr:aminopeptidase O isoform X4 [Siniperca chuatsi]
MEPDGDLNPDTDDLPLRANTNHILVRHYVLDLTVHFDRKVISGSVVLFLEPRSEVGTNAEDYTGPGTIEAGRNQDGSVCSFRDVDVMEGDTKGLGKTMARVEKMFGAREKDKADFQAPSEVGSQTAGETENIQSSHSWKTTSDSDFTLVLDCCDLDVSKVEEVDVTSVSATSSLLQEVASERSGVSSVNPQTAFIQNLISLPSSRWRQKHQLFLLCSRAPGAQDGSSLHFRRDQWSLQVRKKGVVSPQEFPCALRICYETRPTGGSVMWTKDQDNRVCVYTAGSPINNRALFPCQEPPVAMSTWQATVRAPSECVVLMSGEEQTVPTEDGDTRFLIWNYYVTMPMPASTFTLAVGHWCQVTGEIPPALEEGVRDRTDCDKTAKLRAGPGERAEAQLVSGFGSSTSEVVKGFPLQTGSPHIIFLSQSVLYGGSPGSGENGLSLCGSRMCHEIAHSWFGLVIGARDWTEEWISEGFATYLEDIIWAQTQQLSLQETAEQSDLKALLRWRRLSDELQNSEEVLQILRPNMENTGQVSESGSSTVKHALNPDKAFMQVHYLKGYFLLRFLASQVGEQQFIDFFRLFVKKYHGQLILSQDFLRMLLITFPDMERKGLTLSAIYADWLDQPGIPKWLYERSAVWSQARLVEEVKAEVVKWILLSQSHQGKGRKRKRIETKVNYKEVTSEQLVMLLELLLEKEELSVATMRALQRTYNLQNQDAEVRHRWCELVVKHAYTQAYGDVERFLVHDQAMGVYLYGELMVQEDPEQQALACRCLSLVQEEMDQSARRVVEEMVL